MGSALHHAWQSLSQYHISILDPSYASGYKKTDNIAKRSFDIIVLAIKPQILDEVCAQLAEHQVASSLYISIAAGKSLKNLGDYLPDNKAIIRAMPNTPAMIGKGSTVAIGNDFVTRDHKNDAEILFGKLGHLSWIEDETLMDAVTALSGSGPAYLFLLIEELAKAGQAQGLPENLAMALARQTVIGAAALAEAQPDISPDILRQNVTSPGGTTEAALKILMGKDGLADLMAQAVQAATKRSRELS